MTRINKNSRIKGLPAKVILQMLDSKPNTYPGKIQHNGRGEIIDNPICFDDNSSIPFISSSNFNFGTLAPQEIINSKYYETLGQDISSSLYGNGLIKRNVDQFIYIESTQSLEPFIENLHTEIDCLNDPFFLTGSSEELFGNGLSQPLSSKTKIVIDLTPTVSHSFYMENYTSSSRNHPMAYWNKDLKVWEGIGVGKEFATYDIPTTSSIDLQTMSDKHQEFFNDQCIGFGQGLKDGGLTDEVARDVGQFRAYGSPITTFGFPLHPKFHGSSSNEIQLSSFISQPFLLEKVVLEISCTFRTNNISILTVSGQIGRSVYDLSICNFFILNQKYEKITKKEDLATVVISGSRWPDTTFISTAVTPTNLFSPVTFSGSLIRKTRDLLTWASVLCEQKSSTELSSSTFPGAQRIYDQLRENREEIIDKLEVGKLPSEEIENPPGVVNTFSRCDWNKNLKLKFPCKSPLRTLKTLPSVLILMDGNFGTVDSGTCAYMTGQNVPGRKGIFSINPRDYLNSVGDTKVDAVSSDNVAVDDNFPNGYTVLYKENPYILMPSDSLILGWQLPIGKFLNKEPLDSGSTTDVNVNFINGKGPELIFAPHQAKITLYGSYISEGKEYHNTLNQQLNSNVIHQTIGDE